MNTIICLLCLTWMGLVAAMDCGVCNQAIVEPNRQIHNHIHDKCLSTSTVDCPVCEVKLVSWIQKVLGVILYLLIIH